MNPEENKKPIKALRTYQGDVEEALGSTKSSAATIMVAEQKRREERPDFAPKPKPVVNSSERNRLYLVLSSVLIFLAISTIGGVYYIKSRENVSTNQNSKALVGYTQEKKLIVASTSADQLRRSLSAEVEKFKMPANSLLFINTLDQNGLEYPAEELTRELFVRIPAELSRSFDDRYMIGVYSFDTNAPFIILKTNSYQNSYAGMLKWEKEMPSDLKFLFNLPTDTTNEGGLFKDEEYKNKDLRIIRGRDGKSVLLYSFIDRKTLIITTDENVFSAILGKYIISQESR
jgi:hypothetical protein